MASSQPFDMTRPGFAPGLTSSGRMFTCHVGELKLARHVGATGQDISERYGPKCESCRPGQVAQFAQSDKEPNSHWEGACKGEVRCVPYRNSLSRQAGDDLWILSSQDDRHRPLSRCERCHVEVGWPNNLLRSRSHGFRSLDVAVVPCRVPSSLFKGTPLTATPAPGPPSEAGWGQCAVPQSEQLEEMAL
jgi:hypothetical protein